VKQFWPCVTLTLALSVCALNVRAFTLYGYRLLEKQPQPRQDFVQGLQILDDRLYVSTGGYGHSQLLRYDLHSGQLEAARRLDPRLFGEGLAVVGERIYQLTWRARLLLVYERASLQPIEWFRIPGEGWGITYNGAQLIYSDGSDRLFFMQPDSGEITHSIEVTLDGQPVARLNELEWIDGKIWANVWQTDDIVIIDPANGEVTARLDLNGLLPDSDRRAGTDVLNGIAQNPKDGAIWVTGKRWPWRYRIELVPGNDTDSDRRD